MSNTAQDMHRLFVEGRLWRKDHSPEAEGLKKELTWNDLMSYLLQVPGVARQWEEHRLVKFICQVAYDAGLGVEEDDSGYVTQAFVDAREYLRLTQMPKEEAIKILTARAAENRAAHTPKC